MDVLEGYLCYVPSILPVDPTPVFVFKLWVPRPTVNPGQVHRLLGFLLVREAQRGFNPQDATMSTKERSKRIVRVGPEIVRAVYILVPLDRVTPGASQQEVRPVPLQMRVAWDGFR